MDAGIYRCICQSRICSLPFCNLQQSTRLVRKLQDAYTCTLRHMLVKQGII